MLTGKKDDTDKFDLRDYLGKSPTFTVKCSVAHNGLSITTFDALIDMGADAYILISQKFADKLTKHLKLDSKTDFPPGYV